jgi:hypothetical protein
MDQLIPVKIDSATPEFVTSISNCIASGRVFVKVSSKKKMFGNTMTDEIRNLL